MTDRHQTRRERALRISLLIVVAGAVVAVNLLLPSPIGR